MPLARNTVRGGPVTVRTLDVQSLGFATDLLVRRAAGSEIADRGEYLVVRTPENPTFYWGNFILVSPSIPADEAVDCSPPNSPRPTTSHRHRRDPRARPWGSAPLLESGFELEISSVLRRVGPPTGAGVDGLSTRAAVDGDWAQAGTCGGVLVRGAGSPDRGVQTSLTGVSPRRGSSTARAMRCTSGAFVDGRLRSCLGLMSDEAAPPATRRSRPTRVPPPRPGRRTGGGGRAPRPERSSARRGSSSSPTRTGRPSTSTARSASVTPSIRSS